MKTTLCANTKWYRRYGLYARTLNRGVYSNPVSCCSYPRHIFPISTYRGTTTSQNLQAPHYKSTISHTDPTQSQGMCHIERKKNIQT